MFRRCYLHIGTEKTGSSSIQRFLTANRAALPERGFYYPTAFGLPNQIGLTLYARESRIVDELPKLRGLTTPAMIEDHLRAMEASFEAEVKGLGETPLDLLLSNEHLHSRVTRLDDLGRLKSLLLRYCEEIHVVVYLRRQDRVAVSLLSTRLKVGGLDYSRVFPPAGDSDPIYYRYDRLLFRYEQVFGKARCIVRLFGSLIDNDVLQDYAAVVGLTIDAALRRVSPQNESLSIVGQRLLSEMNKRVPLMVDGKINQARSNLGDLVGSMFPGKGSVALREDAVAFQGRFKTGNGLVKKNYFPNTPGQSLFDDDFSMYPQSAASEPGTFVEASEAAARLWNAQSGRVAEIRSELDHARAGRAALLAALHTVLKTLGETAPNSVTLGVLQGVGESLLQAGARAEAARVAEYGLRLFANAPALLLLSGKCLMAAGHWARAERLFATLLAFDPACEEARSHLFEARQQLKRELTKGHAPDQKTD